MRSVFSIISASDVAKILSGNVQNIYDLVKMSYLSYDKIKKFNPPSTFLRFPDKPEARIIALPAIIPEEKSLAGIKWIASNPANLKAGIPRASAVIVLNDYETGYPYVCLEGAIISATRTAHSAVLAAECLNHDEKKVRSLSLIGTGYIAQHIYQTFVNMHWQIDSLILYDKNREQAEKFSKQLTHVTRSSIRIVDDYATAIKQSELIVLTTTSLEPYIDQGDLFAHNPIVLNISLRDLSPEIILNAENIVDDVDSVLSAATSPHLAEITSGHRNFISGTLAQLINKEVVLSNCQARIFSPMGLGILDIALANYVYEAAVKEGLGTKIEDFFNN